MSSDKYLTAHNGLCTVIPLSSKIKYKDPAKRVPKYDTGYILQEKNYKLLSSDSIAQIDQLRTISVVRLENSNYDTLDPTDLNNIKKKLNKYLDM